MSSLPCANTGQKVGSESLPCLNSASNVCKGCFLVQYCSKACQLSHWSLHKCDCQSPLMKAMWKPAYELENRQPTFVSDDGPFVSNAKHGQQKYLWGNVPAVNVVKHLQNEAQDIPEQLHLLFAASGDIRNVVKSLAGLPLLYSGNCEVVINDRDFDIVARNAILLLAALYFDPAEAAPIMLHVWYSALIPKEMLDSLQERILPSITEVCAKIREKPEATLQSKTWVRGSRSLRLVLQKAAWDRLPSYLQVPEGMSPTCAQYVMAATTLAPERRDYLERALYKCLPTWRVCIKKFRQDGILLPFGSPRKQFNTPNPTFFQTRDFWPMMDSADPLEGWSINEVIRKAPLAKNDIYGSLFIHVLDVLQSFCHKLENLRVCFQLFQLDALVLPGIIRQRGMGIFFFDRIEVSNIGDRGYIGPQATLNTFGPLLKLKSQNPHATLLALFLNATHEVTTLQDNLNFIRPESDDLRKYLPLTTLQSRGEFGADCLRFQGALMLFRNYDMLFERFTSECRLKEISIAAGLRMKKKNTIVEPWPMRLEKDATQDEFNLLLASGHTGSEIYVEWAVDS